MKTPINASDILKFYEAKETGRGNNDRANKIRESILEILHNAPEKFINDETYGDKWKELSSKWKSTIYKLCDAMFDDIRVKRMAGRKYKYDFEISFVHEGIIVKTVKVEFKHNCKSINKLPEYYSPYANKYADKCYAEFFYENYLDRVCALDSNLVKPSKDVYMKHVYQPDYSVDPFFKQLYDTEADKSFYKAKQLVVRESVKNFLELYGKNLDIKTLTSDIKSDQSGKVFILWDLKDFKTDMFVDDDLELETIVKIKKHNTVIVKSKSGSEHNLLLRWKNHLGVLYPGWQIKFKR